MRHILILLYVMCASTRAWSQCEESLKAAEKTFGTNFIAEPYFIQGMMGQGDSLSFESLWLANNTYRIATSAVEKQRINISVFDQNNNILFNGSEFNYPSDWDFFVEKSMEVRCVIRCPMPEPVCVTVLTGFKK